MASSVEPRNTTTVLLAVGISWAWRAMMLFPAKASPAVTAITSAKLSGASKAAKPPTTKNAPDIAKATALPLRSEIRSPKNTRPPSTDQAGSK